MRKRFKEKYYICEKSNNGVWFVCDTYEEAKEWLEFALLKAQEKSSKFYIRKERK